MGIINNVQTTKTYKVSLNQMKTLIAADLGVSEDKIEVRYIVSEIGDIFDRPLGHKLTSIEVTVKG